MGFDISYHPVDVQLIHSRLIPYVLGEGSIDDLVDAAIRTSKVRFRANAWGLGVLSIEHSRPTPPAARPSLFSRLLGKAPAPPQANLQGLLGTFNSQLHVWGRPFFITTQTPQDVSRAVDEYLAATPETVDRLARAMLANLNVGLPGHVKPSSEGNLPDDSSIAQEFRWKMDLFREAFASLRAGEEVATPDGALHDPAELFETDFMLAATAFAAESRPGWMARGYVWPTHLFANAGLQLSLFRTPDELFAPLREAGVALGEPDSTIGDNYSLGGYVPPSDVPALRGELERNRNALIHQTFRGEQVDMTVEYQKLYEAVTDAELRGFGFVEASEIYSAPLGIMN